MDKNFNDQELSDIMKEIEALEDNFQSEGGKMEAEAGPVAELVEETAPVHIQEAPQLAETCTPEYKEEPKIFPMSSHPKAKHSSQTSMSFKVAGDLNLELQFDVGGKMVSMEVNEGGLYINMEGGMTFTVPLKKAS